MFISRISRIKAWVTGFWFASSVVDGNICLEFTHAAFIRFILRRPAVR